MSTEQEDYTEQVLGEIPDNVTNEGRAITLQIAPAIIDRHESTRPGTQRICTEIARLARRHHRLAEVDCNEGLNDRQETERENTRERIRELAAALPYWHEPETHSAGPWGATFGGDPRGSTVWLTGPEGIYDDWGKRGVCIPGI